MYQSLTWSSLQPTNRHFSLCQHAIRWIRIRQFYLTLLWRYTLFHFQIQWQINLSFAIHSSSSILWRRWDYLYFEKELNFKLAVGAFKDGKRQLLLLWNSCWGKVVVYHSCWVRDVAAQLLWNSFCVAQFLYGIDVL